MATINSIKGTSYSSFMIGRRGVTIYQGSSLTDIVGKSGDIFINSSDSSLSQYNGTDWNNFAILTSNLSELSSLTLSNGYIKTSTSGFSIASSDDIKTDLGLGTAAYINYGTSSGTVPILDSNGKLDVSVLPSISMTNVTVVDTEDEKPTSANEGDVVIVTGTNKTYICTVTSTTNPTWTSLETSADVSSVNSLTGNVVLNGSNIDSSYNATNFTVTSGSTLDAYIGAIDTSLSNYVLKQNTGTSITYNVGTDENDIPVLDSNGLLDISIIPQTTTVTIETSSTNTFPTSPRKGDFLINSNIRSSFVYDGTSWDQLYIQSLVSINGLTGSSSNSTDGIITLTGSNINSSYTPVNFTLPSNNNTLDGYFTGIDNKIAELSNGNSSYIETTVNSELNKVDTSTSNVTITSNGNVSTEFNTTVSTGETLLVSNATGEIILSGTGATNVDILIEPAGTGVVKIGSSSTDGIITTDAGGQIYIYPGNVTSGNGSNITIYAGGTSDSSGTGGSIVLSPGSGPTIGDIITSSNYSPLNDQSVSTKKYVDSKFASVSQISSVIASQNITASLSSGVLSITGPDLSTYITTSTANSTFLSLTGGELTGNLVGTTASFSGSVFAKTQDVGTNDTSLATCSFVNSEITSVLSNLESVVNGDISTVGNSISLTIPDQNIILVLTSTSSTSAQITYAAVTGTVSPVDIRRVTVWGSAGVESFTLDGGTLTTTPTMADDTIYTQSNDSSAHFVRVNGQIFIITIWISGNGSRASMMYRKLI